MKEKIERHLQQLVGLRLTKTSRAANIECLQFGHLMVSNKTKEKIEIGEFGIHLQCPWRFTNSTRILVGSFDLYEPADENAEYNENFDWDIPNANLRDIRLEQLIITQELFVNSCTGDNFGGIDLLFNGNIKLSVFPSLSKKSKYSEFWRLLSNVEANKNHLIVANIDL